MEMPIKDYIKKNYVSKKKIKAELKRLKVDFSFVKYPGEEWYDDDVISLLEYLLEEEEEC